MRTLIKIVLTLTSGCTVLGLAVAVDMAVSGSILHPLTYIYNPLGFYNVLSWLGCVDSPLPTCNKSLPSGASTSSNNGVVVTTQHIASKAGLQILKQGGNAVDAAVAVGYALAVTDPCCGNIGGGGFMTIRLADGKDTFINFREKAPLASKKNMYLDEQGRVISGLSTTGYLAVAVPGTVKGLDQALSLYGTMTYTQVMAPAIELAQNGFVLQQGDIDILNKYINNLKQQPNVAFIFLKNGKTPYQVGDRLVQKDLAQTLKLIARQGPDAFYKGVIAEQIIRASKEQGGILTLKDFANYRAVQAQPLRCNYRGYEVISAPPPGSGTTVCQMLNILEGYKLQKLGWHSTASIHYMLSAMLYAYADRSKYLGDPDFVKNPVERLLSKEHAAQIRAKILDRRATPARKISFDITSHEGTNTTHYSIQDRYGNAVAVTYTINSNFGAGIIAGKTGFFLNNEMDDFATKPGVSNQFGLFQGSANTIAPGKRPFSSMSPTIISKNGKTFLVTGSPGGTTIPTTILQVITNVIDYGMDVQKAVDSPRIHYQGLFYGEPNVVISEPYALKSTTVNDLGKMGYFVTPIPHYPLKNWGAAESILTNPKNELFYGTNDSRKPVGKAVAY